MPANKVDKYQCRYCKLREPTVSIRLVKGKPRGECIECYRLTEQRRRLRNGMYASFYNNLSNLTTHIFKIIAGLAPNVYPLVFRPSRERVGYLAVMNGQIYVHLWQDNYLFRYDLFGVSTWIANQNLILESEPIALQDEGGSPVALETLGTGLQLERVEDRLVMYDIKLREYAVRKVREELAEAKRAAQAMARREKRKN